MSTNENTPTPGTEPEVATAPTQPVHAAPGNDAPEPDITKAGRNLVLALIVLSIGIGASWLFAGNLFKIALSDIAEQRGGGVSNMPAGLAIAHGLERSTTSGEGPISGGTVSWIPSEEGKALLLADPSSLAGDATYGAVDGLEVAEIPALPSFAAVLDPETAAAEAAAAEAAAAEAAAAEEAAAEEGDAEEGSDGEAVEPEADAEAAEAGGDAEAPAEPDAADAE